MNQSNMAEKDAGRYHYDPYQPLSSKQQHNNGAGTMKTHEPPNTLNLSRTTAKAKADDENGPKRCCGCIGPKAQSFWISLLVNLAICSLLFGYTMLGSFVFLAIEGKHSPLHQKTLASTNRQRDSLSPRNTPDNITLSRTAESAALIERQKTVENIWDITVSLNILYRENWTRYVPLHLPNALFFVDAVAPLVQSHEYGTLYE